MKTKIKRHSRSVLSVILAVCMLVSCMTAGMIMTDAAKVDSETVGIGTAIVKGTWDNWQSEENCNNTFAEISLDANTTYSFVFAVDGVNCASNVTISGTTDYNFPKQSGSITLKTDAAGTYKFKVTSADSGSISTRIEFPASTGVTTWTVAGNSTQLFGSTWADDVTDNDMTNTSGNTWEKTWSNVYLSAGTILYKVVKNHDWDSTSYPSSNASATVPSTGYYNVTATFNDSTHAVNMSLDSAATYALTVTPVDGAVVTASYGGNTVDEGGTLSNIPQNASVTISVTCDVGKSCTNISSTPSATISGSGKTWTLTMPGADVTELSYTLDNEGTKRVYFNNNNVEYNMVSAYVDYNGTKPLGMYPGQTMTKLENSNIWYIDVPQNASDITFVGDNGYNTGSLTIPNSTNPMYTAGFTKSSPATNGTWGTYTARTNEYTVSKGTTLENSDNLFTGISATFYDYYVDSEITSGNWISGVRTDEPNEYGDTSYGYKWDPYTTLNKALSSYAEDTGVQYPLYFGDLKVAPSDPLVSNYYHFIRNVNNSGNLNPNSTAITGLTGTALSNSTIRYYKDGETNENGNDMAMFNEDFLSGVNSQNKTLATILRSAAFPMRKTTEGGTVSSITQLHLDPSGDWANGNAVFDAYFWGSSLSGTWKEFSGSGTDYVVDIPSGAENVIITRNETHVTSFSAWNQSENITLTLSGNSATNKVKFTGWNGDKGTFSSSLDTSLSGCNTTGGHTYYEYDSTGGKDNAYITDIDTTNRKANINYYDDVKVKSTMGNYGFFPFDYNNIKDYSGDSKKAHDQGFGMKLEIPFTVGLNGLNEDGTHQTFDFSGDDDLWVFIDGQLVLDLGGAHARTTGTIDFNTKTITNTTTQNADGSTVTRNGSFTIDTTQGGVNTPHTMTIYYMERGMFDSNLKFGFSFHAIPNQLKVEKKVRTANVNSGFYILNSNTQSDYTVDNGRYVTWFEKSYQYEDFNVYQTSNQSPKGYDPSNHPLAYTLNRAPGSTQAGSTDYTTVTPTSANNYQVSYALRNDFTAYFMDQYNTGTSVTLKEASQSHNLYNYNQSIAVYDDANNGTEVSGVGDATNGYTFTFEETHSTGIDNLNLRARFTNQMISHDLYIYKETNVADADTSFTLNIKVKADSTEYQSQGYKAYPLYCTLDGTDKQLTADGDITIKAGQELIIPKIPENAQIQITETLPSGSPYVYNGADLVYTTGGSATSADVTNGMQFTMGNANMRATIKNAQADPVVISHTMHPDSPGSAYCYVTVDVQNSSGVSQKLYNKTTGMITVPGTYIVRGSTDKLVITLDTTPDGAYQLEHFYEGISSVITQLAATGTDYTAVIDEANMTATVTVPIANIFDSSGRQKFTELPFYSMLQSFRYTIVYTYTSRLWQDQTYTTKGFFTAEELEKYVDHINEEDGIVLKTAETNSPRDEFIQKKAPYEDNFKQTVSWILSDYNASTNPKGVKVTQNLSDNEIRVDVTGMTVSDTTFTSVFELPFAYTAQDTGLVYTDVNEDGSVNYNGDALPFERTTTFEQLYSLNNNVTPSKASFVQAPFSMKKDGVVKYFSYWNVYDIDKTTVIRRCYSRNFNLVFYEPYYIVPVFNEDSQISSQASQAKEWANTKEATIHFLENSRNQWNLGGGNKVTDVDTDWLEYGDRLFSDFVVEYRYNNKLIKSYTESDNVQTGIVIERVKELNDTADGGKDTDLSHYSDVTGAADQGVATVQNYVDGNFAKITGKALLNSAINYRDLDNKNMREVYYGFANIYQADQGVNAGNPTTLKNYLYRAYAYIKVGTETTVVSAPAYFTIYDMASIECYYDKSNP